MQIAPSILNANFGQLQSDINSIKTADRIHLDIMDYQYVPNLSFGASLLKDIIFHIPTEAHLMVKNPARMFKDFIDLGCQTITFHAEVCSVPEMLQNIETLQKMGVNAGICIDGYTNTNILTDKILQKADQILLMSVKAGFGGQKFMPHVVEKIKKLRKRKFTGEIEIDGGVNLKNAPELKQAGANVCVVGSALMKLPINERETFIKDFQAL